MRVVNDVDQPYDSLPLLIFQEVEVFATSSGILEMLLASMIGDSKLHRSAE